MSAAPTPAGASSVFHGTGSNRNSVKFLRACFKKQVLGGGRTSASAMRFWSAVNAFAPSVHAQLDRPGSSRTMAELQSAYDFVSTLLHDDPAALFLFLSNGTPGVSNEVPDLHARVEEFLQTACGRAVTGVSTPSSTSDTPTAAVTSSGPSHACNTSQGSSPLCASTPPLVPSTDNDGGVSPSPLLATRMPSTACTLEVPRATAPMPSSPCSDDGASCYLCGRPQTTSNPVNLGMMRDLRACWATAGGRYIQLAQVMLCPTRSSNHTHCRSLLRSLLVSSSAAAAPATKASPVPGGPSCAAKAGSRPTAGGDEPVEASPASSTGLLDAMARCYPLAQLEAFLHPTAAFKTHRRCRGGLLSLLRMIESSDLTELLAGCKAEAAPDCAVKVPPWAPFALSFFFVPSFFFFIFVSLHRLQPTPVPLHPSCARVCLHVRTYYFCARMLCCLCVSGVMAACARHGERGSFFATPAWPPIFFPPVC
jgi:hypothetical protein